MIDIFEEVYKKDSNAKLLLVGSGEKEKELKKKIKDKNIKNVEFLGKRADISEIMQASDLMVMTSIHEGLPIVCVEAQATGLPLLLSSNISQESNVGGLCEFFELEKTPKEWAEKILSYKNRKRENVHDKIKEKGFDNETAIKFLEKKYIEITKK